MTHFDVAKAWLATQYDLMRNDPKAEPLNGNSMKSTPGSSAFRPDPESGEEIPNYWLMYHNLMNTGMGLGWTPETDRAADSSTSHVPGRERSASTGSS